MRKRSRTEERGSTAWNDELNDLYRAISRDLDRAIERPEGYKGPVTIGMIVLTLVSSGTVTALIDCIKAWIEGHPGRRKLELIYESGAHRKSLVIDATNIDDATLRAALTGPFKSGG